MWATRRRTITLFIVVMVLTLFVGLPYWLTHQVPPTCSDGKKNQNELGVDCGGACALICPGGAKDMNIIWTKVFPVRAGTYDLVAYVENSNFNIAAPHIPYIARLYDSEGGVVAEQTGETHSDPNERFAIFVGNMRTGDKVAVKGSIEIPNTFRWVTSTQPPRIFSIQDKVLVGSDRKPRLTALLRNDTPQVYQNVDVTTVIYDAKGEPIGVSSTVVDKIEKNSSEKLFFTWTAPFNFISESTQCELPVDVILALDRSGSMASESKNPPQPFTRVRDATASFIDFMSAHDQVGMVSFSTTASNPIDQPLTNEISRVKDRIKLTAMGTDGIQYTNIADALLRAGAELGTLRAREDARKIIVLLTDGEALEPNRPLLDGEPGYAKRYAIETAAQLRRADVTLYTIGLGVNANDEFLKTISTTPEYYYASPSVSDLRDVYRQIATAICKKGPSIIEIIPRINNVQ